MFKVFASVEVPLLSISHNVHSIIPFYTRHPSNPAPPAPFLVIISLKDKIPEILLILILRAFHGWTNVRYLNVSQAHASFPRNNSLPASWQTLVKYDWALFRDSLASCTRKVGWVSAHNSHHSNLTVGPVNSMKAGLNSLLAGHWGVRKICH